MILFPICAGPSSWKSIWTICGVKIHLILFINLTKIQVGIRFPLLTEKFPYFAGCFQVVGSRVLKRIDFFTGVSTTLIFAGFRMLLGFLLTRIVPHVFELFLDTLAHITNSYSSTTNEGYLHNFPCCDIVRTIPIHN